MSYFLVQGKGVGTGRSREDKPKDNPYVVQLEKPKPSSSKFSDLSRKQIDDLCASSQLIIRCLFYSYRDPPFENHFYPLEVR